VGRQIDRIPIGEEAEIPWEITQLEKQEQLK
jgi:hypothetical protein